MRNLHRKQRGAALVIALILLVVATLIGLAASRDTILQERMSSNSFDRQMAFQRAEAALRFGEARVLGGSWQVSTMGGIDCSAAACGLVPANSFNGTDALWQNVTAAFDLNDTRTPGVPQYHIAFMGIGLASPPLAARNANSLDYTSGAPQLEMAYYRVTARSSDATPGVLGGRSIVVLQSTARRQF